MKKSTHLIYQLLVILSLFSTATYAEKRPSLIENLCTQAVTKLLEAGAEKESKLGDFEILNSKKVRVIDSSSLYISKNKYQFPPEFDLNNETLVGIDKNGHSFLIINGIEVHGRVISKPILVRKLNRRSHNAEFMIRIKNLSDETRSQLENFVRNTNGKYSLNCLNFLEYVFHYGAGIKFNARNDNNLMVNFEELLGGGLSTLDGKSLDVELYRFSRFSGKNLAARMNKISKIVTYGLPLTMKDWPARALNLDDFLVYRPKKIKLQEQSLLISKRDYNKFVNLQLTSSDGKRFKDPTPWEKLTYPAKVAWNWIYSTIHNVGGAYHVINLMKFKPMKNNLLEKNHPWVTGLILGTNEKVYKENIIFSSPVDQDYESDEFIVNKMGNFLSSMVKKSLTEEDVPQGPSRRMPHVVNYLHGSVAYNSGLIIFNDIRDALFHLSDPKFIKEIYRFAKEEEREFMIILRKKDIDAQEYAFLLGFLRSHLKWYANANKPGGKRVLYGGPSPFPIINVINGNWVKDMYSLINGDTKSIARRPIQNLYFQQNYQGHQENYSLAEKALIYFNYLVLKRRGFQGGLVFSKRDVIEPKQAQKFKEALEKGEDPSVIEFIDNPFKK